MLPLKSFKGDDFLSPSLVVHGARRLPHLHLSLLSVVVVPQHHLAVLPSSGDHGSVLQDAKGEDAALVGPRHHLADAAAACRWERRTGSRSTGGGHR